MRRFHLNMRNDFLTITASNLKENLKGDITSTLGLFVGFEDCL